MASVAELFRGLKNNTSRREALQELVTELSSQEWRELQGLLNPRTFQCDLLANLPLELVLIVASYLDPRELFRIRLVSRYWNQLFRCDAVCMDALARTCDGEDPLELARREGPEMALKRYIQALHAFRCGSFCGNVDFKMENNRPLGWQLGQGISVTFCDGRLAWVGGLDEGSSNYVVVYSLMEGMLLSKYPENREKLRSIALSEHIVATVSALGRCFVWDFRSKEERSFRLTSTTIRTFSSRGWWVGLLLGHGMARSVLVWSYETQAARSIDLTKGIKNPLVGIYGLILHPEERSVVVLGHVRVGKTGELPFEVQYTETFRAVTYSLDGSALASDEISFVSSGQFVLEDSYITPANAGGLFNVHFLVGDLVLDPNVDERGRVNSHRCECSICQFDIGTGRFSLRFRNDLYFRGNWSTAVNRGYLTRALCWKGMACLATFWRGPCMMVVPMAEEDTPRLTYLDFEMDDYTGPVPPLNELVWSDERCAILQAGEMISVWWYEDELLQASWAALAQIDHFRPQETVADDAVNENGEELDVGESHEEHSAWWGEYLV